MITLDGEIRVLEPYRGKHEKIHARPSPKISEESAREALRASAKAADESASTEINIAWLWRELARGTSRVQDCFFSEARCYLVVSLETDGSAMRLEGRRLEILEAVLGGSRQKSIAIDLGLAPSTVALNSRLALESLGVTCKPSRAHPLLMLAASALTKPTVALARCSSFVTAGDRDLRVVSVPRPDSRLQQILPAAELAVIRLLVEGHSYSEIAKLRGTATRTIANQITAVFRRLRVSGRNELVQRLFSDEARAKPLVQASPETLAPPDSVRVTPVAAILGARRSA
jgi:DNA-binding NarL/FixJ family response regulator